MTDTLTEPRLAAETTLGQVQLTITDPGRALDFYERALGLVAEPQPDGTVLLGGAARWPPLLSLSADPAAPPRNPRNTGLYHFAILVPSRLDLAAALVRLARAGWRLDGAADHLVSEALYLSDPDGNGIEIYRDRPREEWPHDRDGVLQMATLPLDLDALVGELRQTDAAALVQAPMAAGTRIGHVHLQVSELERTEAFYKGVIGFDVMVRTYPGALFVSAGGYHHHLGLNTWQSRGGQAPAPGSVGLRAFELRLPDQSSLDALLARIEAAGIPTETAREDATLVRDPSGNGVLLTL
jgi:catechol 2,3-dioxygenase